MGAVGEKGDPARIQGGIGGDLLLAGEARIPAGFGGVAPRGNYGLVIRRNPVRLRLDQNRQPDKELVGDWILGKETRKGRWDRTG